MRRRGGRRGDLIRGYREHAADAAARPGIAAPGPFLDPARSVRQHRRPADRDHVDVGGGIEHVGLDRGRRRRRIWREPAIVAGRGEHGDPLRHDTGDAGALVLDVVAGHAGRIVVGQVIADVIVDTLIGAIRDGERHGRVLRLVGRDRGEHVLELAERAVGHEEQPDRGVGGRAMHPLDIECRLQAVIERGRALDVDHGHRRRLAAPVLIVQPVILREELDIGIEDAAAGGDVHRLLLALDAGRIDGRDIIELRIIGRPEARIRDRCRRVQRGRVPAHRLHLGTDIERRVVNQRRHGRAEGRPLVGQREGVLTGPDDAIGEMPGGLGLGIGADQGHGMGGRVVAGLEPVAAEIRLDLGHQSPRASGVRKAVNWCVSVSLTFGPATPACRP